MILLIYEYLLTSNYQSGAPVHIDLENSVFKQTYNKYTLILVSLSNPVAITILQSESLDD